MPLSLVRRHGRQCRLCHPIVKVGRIRTLSHQSGRCDSEGLIRLPPSFFCCRSLTDCSLSISVSLFLFSLDIGNTFPEMLLPPEASGQSNCADVRFPVSSILWLHQHQHPIHPSIHPSRYITPFCVLVNSLPRLFSLYQLQGCSCRLNDCEME